MSCFVYFIAISRRLFRGLALTFFLYQVSFVNISFFSKVFTVILMRLREWTRDPKDIKT